MTTTAATTGYAPVNGLQMYYEIHGTGTPLILLHGGFGLTEMFAELIPILAANRQVIAIDLQGHGRTADIDRPISLESFGDDVAGLIEHLGFPQADIMGYSMGAKAALGTAIRHPERVRKLVLLSIPFKRSGWYPENLANMNQMGAAAAEFMINTPMYQSYVRVAPHPENFALLCAKMGDAVRDEYDLSAEVAQLKQPTLLIAGDADGFAPAHMAEFFELLGGGLRDGSWDGSGMSNSQLAILPGTTHYNAFMSPLLPAIVLPFLDAPMPAAKP